MDDRLHISKGTEKKGGKAMRNEERKGSSSVWSG